MIKIIGGVLASLFVGLYISFVVFSTPKSDKKVLKKFKNAIVQPTLTYQEYKGFRYRKLTMIHNVNLPTLVFVHGTIGSSTDFKKYMTDSTLLSKANMISFDRIGYNYKDKNEVQQSIAFERDLLEDMIKNLDKKKTIIVGYSFGGPIVLSVKNTYKKLILLAPQVYSKAEKMPFMLQLYRWKLTRWLVPKVWKQASKEKLTHAQDLANFDKKWTDTKNTILCIQGNKDGIVPYKNSLFLQRVFPKNQFELVTLEGAGHGLVWSRFKEIKSQILKQLD